MGGLEILRPNSVSFTFESAPRPILNQRVDSIFAAVTPSEVASLVAAAGISFLAFRESWRAFQPTRHLLAGNYEIAKESAERLEGSWMRVIPGIRASARYAVAASLHLMGRLEESLAATASVDRAKLAPPTRSDFDSLDAASLVLLDRDPEKVLALLAEAKEPEDRMLVALAQQAKGEKTELPDHAPKDDDRASVFHYLAGLHAFRAGDENAARESFRHAADSPHSNIYTRRARAYFETPIEEQGPSSLAPQVVAAPKE